jgi:hypothetical protein
LFGETDLVGEMMDWSLGTWEFDPSGGWMTAISLSFRSIPFGAFPTLNAKCTNLAKPQHPEKAEK